MGLRRRWRLCHEHGFWFGLLVGSLVLLLHPVCCIEVSTPEDIKAVRGETVTLSCSFSSSSRPSSSLSVDWTFRPRSGGPAHTFFHFSSIAYPPEDGQFKGRVKWLGSPSQRDTSIQLSNASLNDNGTYTCAVRNPPDVHGLPSQTILTVTPKRMSVSFSDVAVLLSFILVPSVLVALLLLVRMLCPCCSTAEKNSSLRHHSPIEVTDGEEYDYKQPFPKQTTLMCCDLFFLGPDGEDYYPEHDKRHMEPVAESQC